MTSYRAADGTSLAYRVLGAGPPLVCLAGGPLRDAAYLGDLGLSGRFALIVPDQRGTGRSPVPADPASYQADRLAADVEALRAHLGLDRLDLLGHSAGASIAAHYAARYPEMVRRLVLVTPSTRAIGRPATLDERRAVIAQREHEPWFAAAAAALERSIAGQPQAGDRAAVGPLCYARWDGAARAHHWAEPSPPDPEAVRAFGGGGAFDGAALRAALAGFAAPVLLLAGGLDFSAPPPRVMAEFGSAFPAAARVILPGAGHYPWLDEPAAFGCAVGEFLAS